MKQFSTSMCARLFAYITVFMPTSSIRPLFITIQTYTTKRSIRIDWSSVGVVERTAIQKVDCASWNASTHVDAQPEVLTL